ncbi:MAG: hypothetical protein IKS15_00080 [Opitutales bacterium]|nr:hypothetical protein [Opitutales bacterium]
MMKKLLTIVFAVLCAAAFAQEKIKIACIGDSITEGFGLRNSCTDSYPTILGYMLGDKYEVRNFGITGKCVQKNSNDPYWKSGRIPRIKEFDPDIIIVKLGTNDSKGVNWVSPEVFQADYEAYLDEIANPNKKQTFYLASAAWVKKDAIGITRKVVTEGVNPSVEAIAKRRGLKIIDFHSLLQDHPDWYCDDIHPNEEGAYKMAEFAYKFLTGNKQTPQIPHIRRQKTDFEGFARYQLKFRWSDTSIFMPNKPSKGGEWIWVSTLYKNTPEEREMILAALKKGWHVVYTNIEGWWGNPNSVRWSGEVFKYFPKLLNLSEKVHMAGFGTGAFHAVNFSAKNPDKVEKLYLNKPVLDILAWAKDGHMQTFLREWKLEEPDLENFSDSPLSNLKLVCENGTPLIVLPLDEEQAAQIRKFAPKNAKNVFFIKPASPEKETQQAMKLMFQKQNKPKKAKAAK